MGFRHKNLDFGELRPQFLRKHRADGILRFKMSRVDQCDAKRNRVGKGVVLDVGGDKGVAAQLRHARKLPRAGAAAHGDSPDFPPAVGITQARTVQRLPDKARKVRGTLRRDASAPQQAVGPALRVRALRVYDGNLRQPQSGGKNKVLTFTVSGGVEPGTNLNLSLGQKSARYDALVPNSAVRNDANGSFVLVLTTKSTPLGNRYVATRVDVKVLASDDVNSAVSGISNGDYVITTSSKPIESGTLVRMAEG